MLYLCLNSIVIICIHGEAFYLNHFSSANNKAVIWEMGYHVIVISGWLNEDLINFWQIPLWSMSFAQNNQGYLGVFMKCDWWQCQHYSLSWVKWSYKTLNITLSIEPNMGFLLSCVAYCHRQFLICWVGHFFPSVISSQLTHPSNWHSTIIFLHFLCHNSKNISYFSFSCW